ncbi:MAG: TGS domain-containing protein [Tannerellaceae bacterium]|jgi:GTP pyrophosphokinase|nr:TGS domain-containing protein [Tannerellaceae bacterium]
MNQVLFFTPEEKALFFSKYKQLLRAVRGFEEKGDLARIRELMQGVIARNCYGRDRNGIHGLLRNMDTALIAANEIGLRRTPLLALVLYRPVLKELVPINEVEMLFGNEVAQIIGRLLKTSDLYARNTAIDSENFHRLLFSFAQDVRVILLMIADRLYMMRMGKLLAEAADRERLAGEATYLYAPLAHRLGLYSIKGEMEDLALKYTEPEQFALIKAKLSETKRSRDAYIAGFIKPVKEKLEEEHFVFDIKGRTKSIHSIYNKLKKQPIEFENIYDLFAIRVILDMPFDSIGKERSECWRAFSVITNMYQPNPKRMKDWISIPKSNGYESLHTTVMGPQNRWVEVQIRTRRMDEIAERGLAAHWKYKGGKAESGLDEFLNNVRMALESKETNPYDLMKNFRMDLYKDEIYVFTPQGKLIKLPKGATVLDFAFAVHTGLGSKCVSAKVNQKNVPIRHILGNGDTVMVQTSPTQSPKRGWLSFVTTSKARIKIKQALREEVAKSADFARELLQRRFKNRKIEPDEAVLMRYIKKKGYKTVTEFYLDLSDGKLDPNQVMEDYLELERKEKEAGETPEVRSAENFVAITEAEATASQGELLVIDKDLTGIDYKLAKCCNPIFGDDIFAFVSTQGIKIHRLGCPNEPEMRARFGYRIVEARWSGKGANDYVVNLLVTGRDDIAIVTNITSVIGKEKGVSLRSFTIDSVDGFFQGNFGVLVKDSNSLAHLIGKIKNTKGVTRVVRLEDTRSTGPSAPPCAS